MPAQPEGHQASPAIEPHRARQIAESFGLDAERYERARPRYPDAMVEAIVAASPGPRVLDAGCGTGIAGRQFQAAGCQVLGVDPDARMADLARRSGVAAEVAKFEDWDPAGREFDVVIAGQAWHWVDPVADAPGHRHRRDGGQVHDGLHRGSGDRSAIRHRHPLTRTISGVIVMRQGSGSAVPPVPDGVLAWHPLPYERSASPGNIREKQLVPLAAPPVPRAPRPPGGT